MTSEQWRSKKAYPQERIIIPEDLLKAANGIVLLRKGPAWLPFRGDFILDADLSVFETDPASVLKVVISTSVPPQRLFQLFRHLHCVAKCDSGIPADLLKEATTLQEKANAAGTTKDGNDVDVPEL